jgi:hypothetical protein
MTKPRKGTNEGFRKGAIGINGREGEDFSRKHAVDPWTVRAGDGIASRGAGPYTSNESGLRDTGTDPENYAKLDVFDMVEEQSAKTGPVKLRKEDR